MRFSRAGNAISGTNYLASITSAQDAIDGIDIDYCAVPEGALMCSTGLLVFVLDLLWFIGMGLGCCCCIVGMLCFKDKMGQMQASMKAGM
jgi:hypothetical protein